MLPFLPQLCPCCEGDECHNRQRKGAAFEQWERDEIRVRMVMINVRPQSIFQFAGIDQVGADFSRPIQPLLIAAEER